MDLHTKIHHGVFLLVRENQTGQGNDRVDDPTPEGMLMVSSARADGRWPTRDRFGKTAQAEACGSGFSLAEARIQRDRWRVPHLFRGGRTDTVLNSLGTD